MNCKSLTFLIYSTTITLICVLVTLSHVYSSSPERGVTFIAGGKILNDPVLDLLNLSINEVNFDEEGFTVHHVSVLINYLSLQNHGFPRNGFADTQIYSLLLRFAESLTSKALFEYIAHDFYFCYGTHFFNILQSVPEVRSELFESIVFRVYLDLSSNLVLEERVVIFSSLMNYIRPHKLSFGIFLLSFDYKVLYVTFHEDMQVTEWTLEVDGRLRISFLLGNYGSEEWNLKFVDGNPHFELAKFIVTKAKDIGYSKLAILFSAFQSRDSLSPDGKKAALRIAMDFLFVDAMKILQDSGMPCQNQNSRDESFSISSDRKRKRTNNQTPNRVTKKRRIEEIFKKVPISFKSVKIFNQVTSAPLICAPICKLKSRVPREKKFRIYSLTPT